MTRHLTRRLQPVASDLLARREPDAFVRLRVLDEAGEAGDAAGAADHAGVQADRHHLRAGRGFCVERVEAVPQVLVEVLGGDEAGRGPEAEVVGIRRVGHHQMALAGDLDEVGQVVVVGV